MDFYEPPLWHPDSTPWTPVEHLLGPNSTPTASCGPPEHPRPLMTPLWYTRDPYGSPIEPYSTPVAPYGNRRAHGPPKSPQLSTPQILIAPQQYPNNTLWIPIVYLRPSSLLIAPYGTQSLPGTCGTLRHPNSPLLDLSEVLIEPYGSVWDSQCTPIAPQWHTNSILWTPNEHLMGPNSIQTAP